MLNKKSLPQGEKKHLGNPFLWNKRPAGKQKRYAYAKTRHTLSSPAIFLHSYSKLLYLLAHACIT